jgi:hypothetical protein
VLARAVNSGCMAIFVELLIAAPRAFPSLRVGIARAGMLGIIDSAAVGSDVVEIASASAIVDVESADPEVPTRTWPAGSSPEELDENAVGVGTSGARERVGSWTEVNAS